MLKKFSFAAAIGLVLIATPIFAQNPQMNRGMRQMHQNQQPGGQAMKAEGLNTHQNQQNRQQFDKNHTVKRQQRMEQEQQTSQQNQNQSQSTTVY